MLESLGESLRETIRKIARASTIDKEVIKEVVKDIQRALLSADVNVQLVLKITKEVERRATEEKPPAGVTARNFIVKIIYEELLSILGPEQQISLKPQKILMVGLYGQGKTTTCGKLAKYLSKKGVKVDLVACDVHRPAAYDQLLQIGEKINVPVFGIRDEKNAVKIAKVFMKNADTKHAWIFDTSGRHALEQDLIDEIKELKKIIVPDQIYLVVDATMGQQAGKQAKAFHDAVNITGVIITKLDGSAKGGGALSAVAETSAPVLFIGTGEHIDDFEIFDSKRFLSRLLGMGDLESLMETAQEMEFTEEKAEKTMEKLFSGKFNLKDMYEIWEQFSKPGLMQKIVSSLPLFKLPGSEKLNKEAIEDSEIKLKRYRVILDSMTYDELENPDLIKGSRIERIARGSGSPEEEVRELMREYNKMLKTVKAMKGDRKLLKTLKGQFKGGTIPDLNNL
ncbi:MAG: signal recognition particle protein Srp54 [Thermoplasmata archaeon]